VGNEVTVWVAVIVCNGVAVGVAVWVCVDVSVGVAGTVVVGLRPVLGEVSVLLEGLGAGEPDIVGEITFGVLDPPEQPVIATEASMVNVPKLTAVSLALSAVPAMVVRSFIEPPHVPGRWQFFPPVLASQTGTEEKTRGVSSRRPRWPEAGRRKRRQLNHKAR
jgi:hypothetical protein